MSRQPQIEPKHDLDDIYKVTEELPVRESRCHICVSPFRNMVDRMLAAGLAHKEIAEDLVMSADEFKGKKVDTVRKNVERHAKRHFNARDRALRKIVEKRALEAGIILEEAEGSLIQPRAVLDLIIQRGAEQITDKDSRVKYDTVVDAIRMIEDINKTEYQTHMETARKQVWAISQAVRELVPQAMFPQIKDRARQLFENPDLERALPNAGVKELST